MSDLLPESTIVSVARGLLSGRVVLFVGVLLLSLSQRTAVSSLSPLFDLIRGDMALPTTIIGVIGTSAPLSYVAFGSLTPLIVRRVGLVPATVVGIALTALGLAGRALSPDEGWLVLTSVLAFGGMGMGNVVLAPLVKRYFSDRIGPLTAVYTAGLSIGTLVPPLVAIPIADEAGWRWSLAVWAIAAAAGLLPWFLQWRARDRPEGAVRAATSTVTWGRLARSGTAWAIVGVFTVSGTCTYAMFTWLPTIVTDVTGASPTVAGAILSLFSGIGVVSAVVVPLVASRANRLWMVLLAALVTTLLGFGGFAFVPTVAPWVWAGCAGLVGAYFQLSFVLIAVRSADHDTAVALSGFVNSVGYLIVAVGPLALGLLHGVFNSWQIPLAIMLGVALLAAIIASITLLRFRTVGSPVEASDPA